MGGLRVEGEHVGPLDMCSVTLFCTGIFLWLPYANIFTTGPPVFVNSPFRLLIGKITNCSVETVSRHFSFL